MIVSLSAYHGDDSMLFFEGKWNEGYILKAYFHFPGPNLPQLIKSGWIINLTVQFCLTGIICLEGADKLAGDARAEESLGYTLWQEKLVMAASVSPRTVSQACTVLEQFEYWYLAEM